MSREVSHHRWPRALQKRAAAALLRHIRALARDQRGATLVEFAIVAPVMGLLLMGAFDIAHTLYMRTVLQGVVQKVARDATLETGLAASQQTTLDNRVKAQVSAIANNATITITRKYFRTFASASTNRYEPWTDSDNNGTCNGGEPYEDTNGNSSWNSSGNTGQGAAKDAVVYTVTATYPRLFPLNGFIGGSGTTTVSGSTVLRNQPYGDQATPTVRNCP